MSPDLSKETTTLISILVLGISLSIVIRFFLNSLERQRLKQKKTTFDLLLIQSLKSPLYWTILAITLGFAVISLSFLDPYQSILIKLIFTYLILIWCQALIQFTTNTIAAAAAQIDQTKRSPIKDAVPFLTSLSRILIFFFSLYLIFLTWGVNLTPLIALISIIGAALSFAARDVVGNVLSGMSLFFSRPFQVGDYIKIDDQLKGSVKEIGLQMTQVQAENGSLINLPNSILATKAVINHMGLQPYFTLTLPILLPFSADYSEITTQILKVASENKWLLIKPKPRLRFQKITKDAVHANLIVYLEKIDYAAKVRHQLIKNLIPILSPEKS